MIRIPIPVLLAVVVVLGSATIYFYVTVVSNPVYGAWSDQGAGTTYQFTIPAGQWVPLGSFGGSSITISSNVSINLRAQAFTVQAWSTTLLPPGTWQVTTYAAGIKAILGYLVVNTDDTYSLGDDVSGTTTCSSASVIKLSNGMYMYYPDYTASGADCSNQLPLSDYTISSDGTLNAYGITWPNAVIGGYAISVDGIRSYTINPGVYSYAVGQGNTVYYVYFRPVYTIWVSPSANASITVTVLP
jgi:hypothetical protein